MAEEGVVTIRGEAPARARLGEVEVFAAIDVTFRLEQG